MLCRSTWLENTDYQNIKWLHTAQRTSHRFVECLLCSIILVKNLQKMTSKNSLFLEYSLNIIQKISHRFVHTQFLVYLHVYRKHTSTWNINKWRKCTLMKLSETTFLLHTWILSHVYPQNLIPLTEVKVSQYKTHWFLWVI